VDWREVSGLPSPAGPGSAEVNSTFYQSKVRLLTKELTPPNGWAFSPDGRRFYLDDSPQRNIRGYDAAADWTLNLGRIFGEEPGGNDDGVPDGIKVDIIIRTATSW
jgi:sugar lactone lactonase YvrE